MKKILFVNLSFFRGDKEYLPGRGERLIHILDERGTANALFFSGGLKAFQNDEEGDFCWESPTENTTTSLSEIREDLLNEGMYIAAGEWRYCSTAVGLSLTKYNVVLCRGLNITQNKELEKKLSNLLKTNIEVVSPQELEERLEIVKEMAQGVWAVQKETLSIWGIPDEEEWGAEKVPQSPLEIERHPAFWWPVPLSPEEREELWQVMMGH